MLEEESNKMTTGNEVHAPVSNSMAAFSRQLKQLAESLSILYIKNNAGGRRIFRDKWPEVADYVFGKDLTAYDTDGVKNDYERTHRSKIEDEADMRRIDLKKTMGELVENSVDAGSLKFDYVGNVVDKYGALLSQFLYEESVIERVRPGALDKAKKACEAEIERVNNEQSAPQEPQADEEQDVAVPQEVVLEQRQDIVGTQNIFEQGSIEDQLQQNELVDVSEELVQQPEPLAEPFELNHIQSQVGGECSEDDKLSAEEIAILSNKVAEEEQEIFEPDFDEEPQDVSVQDEPESFFEDEIVNALPEREDDPLERVRPIETPMPESAVLEGEVVHDVLPEDTPVETDNDELFVEQQQIHAAEVVREILGDETQSLVAPDLLDLNEALAAQKTPNVEELLAQGILQEGDFPEWAKFEEEQRVVLETEPRAQTDKEDEFVQPREVIAEPVGLQNNTQGADPVFSLEEERLREDLSEALKGMPQSEENLYDTDVPDVLRHVSEQEVPESTDIKKTEDDN
jgi:hypothetical protein